MSAIVPHEQTSSEFWMSTFSDVERRQQLNDDAVAWGRVTGVLMVVVTLGLLISIAAVIIAQSVP